MEELIKNHLNTYPAMKTEDLVKLIFQSEFGGGHLIVDKENAFERLCTEWKNLDGQRCGELHAEPIGGGLARVYLDSIGEDELSLLFSVFVKSASAVTGSVDAFEKKLQLLKEMCDNGKLPFSSDELTTYLGDYKRRGYPPVSHSESYREAYHPAYRVVKEEYIHYWPVLLAVANLCREKKSRVMVSIDGKSGSGKTTLAEYLSDFFDCTVFHLDHYFLRPEQRSKKRLAEPGGNVDYERFRQEVTAPLSEGAKQIKVRDYDCQTQTLGEERMVEVKDLVILEGSYSCHPYFENKQDLRIFLAISPKAQAERIEKRNGSQMLKRFLEEWIPKENRYFEAFQIPEHCQIILENRYPHFGG